MSSESPVPPSPETPSPATPAPATPSSPPAAAPDEQELRKAFSAFKKRLKAFQLETDSKLGRAVTTGRKETITEIQPPVGFGKAVWEELARIGWLKYEGRGFYKLIKKD